MPENNKYSISNIRVIDGDTIEADISLNFDVLLLNQRIRLQGIQAPETNGANKQMGLISKQFLGEQLSKGDVYIMTSVPIRKGSFSRWLAEIIVKSGSEEIKINQLMLSERMAVEYKK